METKQNVTNIILAIILAVVLLFGGIISAGIWDNNSKVVSTETTSPIVTQTETPIVTIEPTPTSIETEVPTPVVTPIPSVEPTPIPTPTPVVLNPIPETYNMVLPIDFALDYREGEFFEKDILKTSSIAIVIRDYAEDFGIQGEWKVIKFSGCMMFNDKNVYGTTPVESIKNGDMVIFGVKPTGANTIYIEIGYFYNGDNLNSKFITFTTN